MKTFGNIFTYEDQYSYDEGIHAFIGCKLLNDLGTSNVVFVHKDELINEVLINLLTNTIKIHIDDKIYVCSLSMSLDIQKIKCETESDSDFEEYSETEYETESDESDQ